MGDLINILLNTLINMVVYITTLIISIGGSIIRVISNPFTGFPVSNRISRILETSSKIFINSLSEILINGRNLINSGINTILGGILDTFKIGSSVIPVFGIAGVTSSIVLEYIITYALAIITAIPVIYLTLYALYYILYVIFHLFTGIFIAKLLALIFVTLFIWLIMPSLVYFKSFFLGTSVKIIKLGKSNPFLTIFISIIFILFLTKVYELYSDEEDEEEEDEEEDEEDEDDEEED